MSGASRETRKPKFKVGQVVVWDGDFCMVRKVRRASVELMTPNHMICEPRFEFVRPLTKREAGR